MIEHHSDIAGLVLLNGRHVDWTFRRSDCRNSFGADALGRVLRYVAEYRGQWVELLILNSAAYHLKLRDRWLHWVGAHDAEQRRGIAPH